MSRYSHHSALAGFALLGSLFATTFTSAATIQLKARATVSGAIVRLGDLADVVDRDAKNQKFLEAIELGPAPSVGNEVLLDYSAIKSRMKSLGVDLSRIDFAGRSIVRVTRTSRDSAVQQASFTANRRVVVPDWQRKRADKLITEAVLQSLHRSAPEIGNVNVAVDIKPEDVAGVLTAARQEYDIRGMQKPWLGTQELTIAFLDRDEKLHKAVVTSHVSHKPFVWAVRHAMRRGQTIQAADLVQKQVDDTRDGLTEIEQIVGQETIRPITRDAVVKTSDMRRVLLIKTNDSVTVTARHGRIVVERIMKARQSGALGDRITLVELKGRGEVTARITGRFHAEILSAPRTRLAILKDDSGFIEFRKAPTNEPDTSARKIPAPRELRNRTEPEWQRLGPNIRPASSSERPSGRPSILPPVPTR